MAVHCSDYVSLKNNTLSLNGKIVVEQQPNVAELFAVAYQQLNCNYHKFYKMDNLCKTGFLAVELLLQNFKLNEKFKPEESGMVFSNRNSSLDTDIKYEASTHSTTPSPALFVYTLPNVLIGELCIRHKIKGETACFVFDSFDAWFQTDYVNMLFETAGLKVCISGWADFYDEKAEAFFYLAQQNEGNSGIIHNAENIKNIYSDIWKN